MGSGYSQAEIQNMALELYQVSFQTPCLLPDVGIDESLLKYSGLNSTSELQFYSNDLVDSVPGYVEKLGSALGSLTPIPNVVGLGALVISMIIEIIVKSSTETSPDAYGMFRRVFGEEKASAVRDTMYEYVQRHRMFMNDERRLEEEIGRLEKQLHQHLAVLINSLLQDEQMSSRGFKIWVNGAYFHLQMLIHEARLKDRADQSVSHWVETISVLADIYLEDLDHLLTKYKAYRISKTKIPPYKACYSAAYAVGCYREGCQIINEEREYCRTVRVLIREIYPPCGRSDLLEAYVNHIFSNYQPLATLRGQYLFIKNNIMTLINRHDNFTLPQSGLL